MAIYLGLGSNLGDKAGNLRRALTLLAAVPEVTIVRQSRFYETPPWGDVQQDTFLNAVAEMATTLDPRALLSRLKEIERQMGREPTRRWGPRIIDLDILLFNDVVVATPDLVIPHAHLRERAFMLVPLLELAPDLVDPLTRVPFKHYLESVPEKDAIKAWLPVRQV
jgi:2-amino-4-hydroxy-6-hydroxymethyldihydropteridine diphosphokinase